MTSVVDVELGKEIAQLQTAKRKYFRDLPRLTETDLVEGSYWFVWGSLLGVLIPVFPLISLWSNWWEDPSPFLPREIHLIAYLLLIAVSIFFTYGSYLFLRAVHPRDKLSPVWPSVFINDETYGVFHWFVGTMVSIPLLTLYVIYEPSLYFRGALVVSVFFTFLAGVAFSVLLSHAKQGNHIGAKGKTTMSSPNQKPRHAVEAASAPSKKTYIACFCELLCCGKSDHYANDLLVLSWLSFIGSLFAVLMCAGMLGNAIYSKNSRAIFDYSTGLLDMCMFAIGSMYFVSGFYDDQLKLSKALEGAYLELSNRDLKALSSDDDRSSSHNSAADFNSANADSPGKRPDLTLTRALSLDGIADGLAKSADGVSWAVSSAAETVAAPISALLCTLSSSDQPASPVQRQGQELEQGQGRGQGRGQELKQGQGRGQGREQVRGQGQEPIPGRREPR